MTDRTHGPFKVGDLVEIVSTDNPSFIHLVGTTATVVELPEAAAHFSKINGKLTAPNQYLVECAVGFASTFEHRLRRIDPPSDQYIRQETTDWSKCAWQPQRTEA